MTAPTVWIGCYDESYRGIITDASFAHPAKAARGLLRRIFDHAFEQGWLWKGAVVVDPFGGVGTTGIEAASRGCRCYMVELESRFVEFGKANIELHRAAWEACGDPIPEIYRGDSRDLVSVLDANMWCTCDEENDNESM